MVRNVLCLFSFLLLSFLVFDVPESYPQAFPSTPVLDNFNRPDEGPPGGPNWVASTDPSIPAHLGISVKNNKAVGLTTTMSYSSVWTTSFSQDQEVYFTYGAKPGTHACMGPSVRVKVPSDLSSNQYLAFFCQDSIGQNRSMANIWRRANSKWTLLKQSTINADIQSGDQIGLRAVGNNIKAYLNGNVVSSVTDSNPVLGGGFLQLYIGDDVGHVADNFGGGNVSSSSPPPSGGEDPTINSPASGSVLSGSTVTFSWSGNGTPVQDWWLHIGSSKGAFNLADTGSLPASTKSKSISGLPTNGSAVWARLWYRPTSGGWKFVDAQYTAKSSSGGGGGGGGNGPAILSPSTASPLPGSSVTFSWAPNGTPVLNWWLHIGSSKGAFNLADTGSLPASIKSKSISGLPTNGSTVWARLWHRTVSNGWKFVDVQYTASGGSSGNGGGGGNGPAILSPSTASPLPGSSATFSWTANGAGVGGWWLYVGTSKGTKNILDTGSLASGVLSRTVSGLPTNGGAVWVRLWWFIGSGSWQFLDVQYTAAP